MSRGLGDVYKRQALKKAEKEVASLEAKKAKADAKAAEEAKKTEA